LKFVKFMHERGYIHGDLKPRNVMRVVVDSKRHILLIDLDASAAIGLQYSWSKPSSAYMPPEAVCLSLSLVCDDLLVSGAPTSAQFTIDFKFLLPMDVAAGSTFTIKFSPVNVTGVLSLMLDDAVDLSSCMSVKDHVITVTAKDALAAGSRRFTMVATFNGNPTATSSVSARFEHVVNTLRPVQGVSKDSVAKCIVTIRNPTMNAISSQQDQLSPFNAQSLCVSHDKQIHPDSSSRLPPSSLSTKRSSLAPTPKFPPESAIASMLPDLPPIKDVLLPPAVSAAVAMMQNEYAHSATNALDIIRSMRKAWVALQKISSVNASRPANEQKPYESLPMTSPVPLEHAACAPDVPCECTCDQVLPPGMRSGDAFIAAGCAGLCGLAHVSHDMWALGVILYRFCARRSLWSEDDEDNIKDDSGLMELALWTDDCKQERLQRIDDTATRELVSKLLAKEPWKRPRSIDDVLALPFNEADVIKLKLQETVPHDAHQSSNFVGSVKDLRTGKFSDAAFGLRPYLKVADDWDEAAACTLQGMQDEVELLKDCADCARVQADVLQQLGRSEAAATQKLASALAELKEHRKKRAPLAAAATVKQLRSEISATGGWYYGDGMPNYISWPADQVKVGSRTFCQPMCKGCQAYCLDYSIISADLRYIIYEPAVEKKEWNGVRDHGRAGRRLKDFMELPQAKASHLKEAELVALRFYTSHSFNALNIPMRDFDRQGPHPLPAIMMNIQTALKKLRALGADDASSKQTVVLWRGMSYMQLPQKFSAEGGTELAPMSTTTDVSVAISYAVKKDTRSALLFRFVTRNNLERGADVQWLSMFPCEAETLFPPLTFLQRTRTEPQDVVHNGVKVTIVELSATLA
jgi:serine/threonine protein kinase